MALAVDMKLLFSILVVLHHVAAITYAQDDQSADFISIDCGSGSNYTQEGTWINYVSDDGFIEGGESHNILPIYNYSSRVFNTLRSFPKNERNCYTLRPQKGKNNRYLIRAMFFYGNYDAKGQPPTFDLYIGADYWVTVNIIDQTISLNPEMIYLTSSDYINICLVNTGHGYPFITALELRLLDITMYKEQPKALNLFDRLNFGTDDTVRYEDDKYDRIWYSYTLDGGRAVQTSDTVSLGPNNDEQVPSNVMSTAVTPTISTGSIVYSWDAHNTNDEFMIYVYLSEVEKLKSNQSREVIIYVNESPNGPFSVSTDIMTIRNDKDPYTGSSSYTLKINKTLNSTLPPILNALEIYTLKQLQHNQTDDQDAAAIRSTKSSYGFIETKWQGDPCVPQPWFGLNCNYDAPGAVKIISVNLSSRGLSREIAPALANLTMIESLDLSHNNLTGNVPDFLAKLDNLKILNLLGNNFTKPLPPELLAKSKKGSLSLSIEESSDEDNHNKYKIVVISAIVVLSFLIVGLSTYAIVWKVTKRKPEAPLIKSEEDFTPRKQQELTNAEPLIKSEEDFTPRKQQFTYYEVVTITDNFRNEIGRGGFGSVFHGFVGNNQVAVKMLSESSSQGYKEFQAEVKLLMEIHHKNITSLVGYCNDNNHKAIIYDFMDNGNLEKHLFDGSPNVLSWERRLQIGCDAAEGLAYMHHGCRPPIVHRDVKPSNILLNEGFQARLSDFGLSRTFRTEDASHVTTFVAGTIGYLDPECLSTKRVTQKNDVYSFGVVLMGLITGQPAISSEGENIINRVKRAVEDGNVDTIIDSRLGKCLHINTALKVAKTAIACVSRSSIERPTVNDVLMDLKRCLQAVKTRQTHPPFNLEIMSGPHSI